MKGFGWHEGDRSEYVALFAFSTIAYCSSVPRQFDHFGVDFFAHIARWQGKNLVATGRAVCAQVKSDIAPILLDKPEHRRCLYEPSVPFFYVVVDKMEHSIQVYTTIDRLHAYWEGWSGRIWVIPGDEQAAGKPENAVDGDHFLYLRKPIYHKPLAVLEDDATKKVERELFLRVIEGWAWWEQIHLAFKEVRFPLYSRVEDYTTNEPPIPDTVPVEHRYYPSPSYLEAYCRGMRLHTDILRKHIGDMEEQGEDGGIPNFAAWATAVKASIDKFLEVSTLPDPPNN